ncbi:uncharacterized protein LOC127833293 isoform X2 [Dreissena polymorpha]|uniref:uncharacterized protein LOC127833293 isoform X2 n=1 Tax=Dreissena polymorpha TaxID=45954 RepID=UPI0022652F24|nr:uncharacterized protein LOC127833293 isoform X2 [Dreissena polymorpha]
MWRVFQYPGQERYTRVAASVQNQMRCQSPRNDAFKYMTDTKQDVEAVPISPTSAVHQGCSVSSKQDEVSKPQINDAFKHITDGVQEDVEAVPIYPTSAVHQGCSVGSKPNEVSKPQINDAFKHMTDTKQDVEAVPISPTAAVHQGCSVGSKQDEVSKPHINDAFKHITDNKRNKQKMLPLSEDISKLQTHLQRTSESLTEALEERFFKHNWELLSKVTLAKLVLFNRRRGGETERIEVVHYENRRNKSEQAPKEVEDSLSETEKVPLRTLSRVEIRGKRDRTVAVLLTPDIQKNIDLLLRYRADAGVDKENAYVFARSNSGSQFPLRSADVLRKFAKEASLECPESVTSTKLRKHVATVVQILNLSKNDLEVLARFMGHDINIHRSFYRLPQEIIEVARMGCLLTAFNKGTIGQFSGKSIDDIDLELDNGVNSESEDSNDEEEIHEADDLTENAIEEDMETVPVSTLGAVQGCSVRSNRDKVTEPKKSGNNRPKTGEVVKLTEHQHRLLKTLFKTNIAMRRELQKDECEKVSRKHDALQNLTWKKIKNTVHNWIMAEKRKTKRY